MPIFSRRKLSRVALKLQNCECFLLRKFTANGMTVVKNSARGSRTPDFPVSKPMIERYFFHVLQSVKDYNKSTTNLCTWIH